MPVVIEKMLNAVEADAGMPNRPFVFSTPIANAAKATSRMNGNIICVSVTARAAFSGGKPRARSGTTKGAIRMPVTVMPLIENQRRELPCLDLRFLYLVIGKDLDECRRKSPFGKEVAEYVRYLESDDERVVKISGAKEAGENGLADEPEDAGEHHGDRDYSGGLCDASLFGRRFGGGLFGDRGIGELLR